jgi:maltose O-acetyltransferase
LVKRIFKKCGHNADVDRRVQFGSGKKIEIDNNSGIGINCHCPSNIIIGNDVMMR